jgi:hypothetical protein
MYCSYCSKDLRIIFLFSIKPIRSYVPHNRWRTRYKKHKTALPSDLSPGKKIFRTSNLQTEGATEKF